MTDVTTLWTAVYIAMLAAFTGYVVTERILQMFDRSKKKPGKEA